MMKSYKAITIYNRRYTINKQLNKKYRKALKERQRKAQYHI